jgi:hypothetical protein
VAGTIVELSTDMVHSKSVQESFFDAVRFAAWYAGIPADYLTRKLERALEK